jgi:CheY-like chemotaxis protein
VASELGAGSTFTVWLPLVGSVTPRTSTDAIEMIHAGSDSVLLVEDEQALRNVVELLLAEVGYQVLVASTPTEALEVVASGVHIDLLLTDVVMPGMSGPKLAGEIARSRPDILVLYMSGYVGNALSEHGLDERAPLLHKPFTPERLLQMVRDTLDAHPRRLRNAREAH